MKHLLYNTFNVWTARKSWVPINIIKNWCKLINGAINVFNKIERKQLSSITSLRFSVYRTIWFHYSFNRFLWLLIGIIATLLHTISYIGKTILLLRLQKLLSCDKQQLLNKRAGFRNFVTYVRNGSQGNLAAFFLQANLQNRHLQISSLLLLIFKILLVMNI